MTRKRTIEYAVYDVEIFNENVCVQSYTELFKYFKNKENRRDIPIKNVWLSINLLSYLNDDKPEEGFIGKIIKWDTITTDFYNDDTGQKADAKDLQSVQIPDNLKANPRFFNFVFYPIERKIICEISERDNEISENILCEFFRALLGQTAEIVARFKRVETKLLTQATPINNIISNNKLLMVNIVINIPEDMPTSKDEIELILEMKKRNISSYQKILESPKRDFLKLSLEDIKEISLSKNLGFVDYKAESADGRLIHGSTSASTPYIKKESYNPELKDPYHLIKSVSREIIDEIK